jgi:hypothetical protein
MMMKRRKWKKKMMIMKMKMKMEMKMIMKMKMKMKMMMKKMKKIKTKNFASVTRIAEMDVRWLNTLEAKRGGGRLAGMEADVVGTPTEVLGIDMEADEGVPSPQDELEWWWWRRKGLQSSRSPWPQLLPRSSERRGETQTWKAWKAFLQPGKAAITHRDGMESSTAVNGAEGRKEGRKERDGDGDGGSLRRSDGGGDDRHSQKL